jgi:SAM-dependent methyltransferase
MSDVPRYDGLAEWYDATFVDTEGGRAARRIVAGLLGEGAGTLLDVGCGTGGHSAAFAELGWTVSGVDHSEDQLRLARARGLDVIHAHAEELPFEDASFDAVVSMWTHTDVDDFPAELREIARVLRQGGRFVYLGAHPCFVGPHSRFIEAKGIPFLHPGYLETGRYTDSPGTSPEGLRAKVGAVHLPLGAFVQTFLDAGFILEHFEEPLTLVRDYPHILALGWRR